MSANYLRIYTDVLDYTQNMYVPYEIATCVQQPCLFYLIYIATYHFINLNRQLVSYVCTYVMGFRKTDHIVTIDIARNTDLKY